MAVTKTKTETHTETVQTDPLHRARGFWADYSKQIIIVGSIIILAIGGWYGYQAFIKAPKEKKASELIFPAENLFSKMATTGFSADTVNIVLNGGDVGGNKVTGLLSIIKNYGGTDAGNRANYMAGATYLQIKDYEKAIRYLKAFDGNGANQVASRSHIMLGHAYAEQKKTAEALSAYKKAADVSEKDEYFGADALMVAATYADVIGNQDEAKSLFKKLKTKFPTSTVVQNGEVDKYLAKLGDIE